MADQQVKIIACYVICIYISYCPVLNKFIAVAATRLKVSLAKLLDQTIYCVCDNKEKRKQRPA